MVPPTGRSRPMVSLQAVRNSLNMQEDLSLRVEGKDSLKAWKVTLLGATSNSR